MRTALLPLPLTSAAKPVVSTSTNTRSHNYCRTNNFNDGFSSLGLLQPCSSSKSSHCHFNSFLSTHQSNPTSSVKCSSVSQGEPEDNFQQHHQGQQLENQLNKKFWDKWKNNSAEMRAKLAKVGLAAVLAYGLFDGVAYTTFFVLAFLGYEKSTGNNPAANLKALLGIVILMWTGNNVTRPFRVAGAAALAPFMDKGLRKIQKYFNFPNLVYAFALVVGMVAGVCLTVAGLLILSRWGK